MAEQKSCKQCGQQFDVTDDDLAFLEKISPELEGQKVLIDPPKLCHECRVIRRMNWRNERTLYKTKSAKSGKDIISIYAPDSPYKVFSNDEWQSDGWDPMEFGRDYDSSRSFFEQFNELLLRVPRKASNAVFNENCDYCNQSWHSTDSYLCFNLNGERCYYCNEAFYVKDCVDCFDIRNCEYCFGCYDCGSCSNCQYLDHCKECVESYFSYDCAGCKNIILCSGLHNKQYCIENKQLTKEEYELQLKEMDFGKRSVMEQFKQKFDQLKRNAIHKCDHNIKIENCTGDYIIESKNCKDCFNIYKSENCVRISNIDDKGRDCRDLNYVAEMELCYEGTSIAGYKNIFCAFMPSGRDNYYCNFCETNNCLGCVGLKKREFCILNKQYSKEEYEKKVTEIIGNMKKSGEWGEYFPAKYSVFSYNETVAMDYFPKTKDEVEKIGARWQENDFQTQYEGESYDPEDDIAYYADSNDRIQKVLDGVIKCKETGKPFKIMPQEILFYIKNNIPIPVLHPDVRFKKLFALRNPRVLYERQCMCEESGHGHEGRCKEEFETTYAPQRPEKVYCEDCYQKSVI